MASHPQTEETNEISVKESITSIESSIINEVQNLSAMATRLADLSLTTKAQSVVSRLEMVYELVTRLQSDIKDMKFTYSDIFGK
jgi:hypothetical protein